MAGLSGVLKVSALPLTKAGLDFLAMETKEKLTKIVVCSSIFAAMCIFIASCSDQPGGTVHSPSNSNMTASNGDRTAAPAPTADLMATGRKLYLDNCALCHKEDGTGGRIEIEGASISPEDLTAKKIKEMDDARIYRYIYEGLEEDGMPAFKDKLSEAEIREVVRYLRIELQKIPGSSAPNGANTNGR